MHLPQNGTIGFDPQPPGFIHGPWHVGRAPKINLGCCSVGCVRAHGFLFLQIGGWGVYPISEQPVCVGDESADGNPHDFATIWRGPHSICRRTQPRIEEDPRKRHWSSAKPALSRCLRVPTFVWSWCGPVWSLLFANHGAGPPSTYKFIFKANTEQIACRCYRWVCVCVCVLSRYPFLACFKARTSVPILGFTDLEYPNTLTVPARLWALPFGEPAWGFHHLTCF